MDPKQPVLCAQTGPWEGSRLGSGSCPAGPGAHLPTQLFSGVYPPCSSLWYPFGSPAVAPRLSFGRHSVNKHNPVGTAASWSRPETLQCVILVTYITSLPRSTRVSPGHFIPAVPPPPTPLPVSLAPLPRGLEVWHLLASGCSWSHQLKCLETFLCHRKWIVCVVHCECPHHTWLHLLPFCSFLLHCLE